jgi:AraC-like DNA-binding protein
MAEVARTVDSGCTGAVLVDTRELGSAEGRARWADTLDSTYCEMDVDWPRQRDPFAADLTVRPFGDLTATVVRADPHAVLRTEAMIRSDPSDDYLLCLITRGSVVLRQHSRSATLERGSFGIVDAAVPFMVDGATAFEQVVMRAPRELLAARLPAHAMDDVTAVGISGQTGIGRLVSRLLVDVATSDERLSPRSSAPVAASAVDLLVAAINDLTPPLKVTQRQHLRDLHNVQRAMRHYLHDPDHTTAEIGVELGMSVRYIHKLFSAAGTTPRTWLYQLRLERARNLVSETGFTVAEISERVGFRDVSHFSRIFRARFGESPGHFRTHCRPPA